MMLLWILASLSMVVAAVSWVRVRRVARKLAQLTELYWELKYQHGELRAQVARQQGAESGPVPPPGQPVAEAFVSLASLKR